MTGHRPPTPEGRWVLVTGASGGIGAATVTALVSRGFAVWATVRREAEAEVVREQFGPSVRPLLMDLEDADSIQRAGATVEAAGPLYALVNNAGIAVNGPLMSLPIESFRRQLEVNLTGQLAVTQAMLPALLDARTSFGTAKIIMIGSIGGRVSVPGLGAYNSAKHGLVGMTGSLAAELRPSGITVVLVEPGATATKIWGAADRSAPAGMPPSTVAEVIAASITQWHPRPRRVVGREAHVIAALSRILSEARLDRLLARRGAGRANATSTTTLPEGSPHA